MDKNKLNFNELKDLLNNDFKIAFFTKIIASIHILCIYKKVINNPKHIK